MINRKMINADIFCDTEWRYSTDPKLIQAVDISTAAQVFIGEKSTVDVPAPTKTEKAKVIVSKKRSIEASESYAKCGKRVCVLNFASAKNPGGGVVNGSSAQEEAICRCTTLYPSLDTDQMWDAFYTPHRNAANPLYNDDCIYTPDVCVFKSDIDFPEPLPEEEWWSVDILTCAAPNLRERPSKTADPYVASAASSITPSELEGVFKTRIRRIFDVAAANAPEVLILGAFGCGAFGNSPALVAKAFSEVMQDYLYHFDTIEYAVFHTEREVANYEEFLKAMT